MIRHFIKLKYVSNYLVWIKLPIAAMKDSRNFPCDYKYTRNTTLLMCILYLLRRKESRFQTNAGKLWNFLHFTFEVLLRSSTHLSGVIIILFCPHFLKKYYDQQLKWMWQKIIINFYANLRTVFNNNCHSSLAVNTVLFCRGKQSRLPA